MTDSQKNLLQKRFLEHEIKQIANGRILRHTDKRLARIQGRDLHLTANHALHRGEQLAALGRGELCMARRLTGEAVAAERILHAVAVIHQRLRELILIECERARFAVNCDTDGAVLARAVRRIRKRRIERLHAVTDRGIVAREAQGVIVGRDQIFDVLDGRL